MGAGGIPAPVNSEMGAFGAAGASWKNNRRVSPQFNDEMTKHHTSCAAACLPDIRGQSSADLS